jgi:hypothetical protein
VSTSETEGTAFICSVEALANVNPMSRHHTEKNLHTSSPFLLNWKKPYWHRRRAAGEEEPRNFSYNPVSAAALILLLLFLL